MRLSAVRWLRALIVGGLVSATPAGVCAQPAEVAARPALPASTSSPDRLPINLPTALQLAQARTIDVEMAAERTQVAQAQLQRARVAWLPSVVWGTDYARHDGKIQDIVGNVITTHRDSLMFGAGPSAVFSVSEAIYAPLAARQEVRSRQFDQQRAVNDTTLAVAEAYFNVQQARGELAGAAETARQAEELVRRAEKLAAGLISPLEVNRGRADLARRRQAVELAQERWLISASELNRLLRLSPSCLVEPVEQPQLRIELIDIETPVDTLIPVGLTNRPELASQQALVQATLVRLRQQRLRPLTPSVLLRGNATNPGGSLAGGTFGGGVDGGPTNWGGRHSFDVQILWELQNLGLGNRAATRERQAENRLALLELFRTQDRVAAEVVQAHAQVRHAANRVALAEEGVKEAAETLTKSLEALAQTRRVGETLVLVVRPQEVVAAVQALDQAYRDYFGAVGDANRAQFRLYRALGYPANCLKVELAEPAAPAGPTPSTPPELPR